MRKTLSRTQAFIAVLGALVLSPTASAQWPDGGPDITIDAGTKSEVIDVLVRDLRGMYVFPDVGDKVAQLVEQGHLRGAYNSISNAKEFAEVLNRQMYAVARDPHLHVLYSSQALPALPAPGAEPQQPDPQMLAQFKKDNYSFQEVKRLSGNIGYLKLSAFSDAASGGSTVAGAMAVLANTDALIIDLRENSGGYAAMVALLASYFFNGEVPVHLNDLEWRKEGTREYSVAQWWVFPFVPGPRYVDKEVYVLTSHGTLSAAEEFTYDLQTQKRATVVGETTWGGANPGAILRLGDHFQVFMPEGRAINPVTKTNWEGIGVKPNIAVPQEEALKVAQRTALLHLIGTTTDDQQLANLRRALAVLEAAPAEPPKQ
jgi:hypothetical protein